MRAVTRREIAFLLIGLGVGLLVAAAVIVETAFWMHHMFIIGIQWRPASIILVTPFVMIVAGAILLGRHRSNT
jgi:hypothetical protein